MGTSAMSGYPDYSAGSVTVRRRHWLRTTVIVLVVVAGLLVGADFAARAVAEDVLATQIKSHGFPRKPDVAIRGFPFLTQVAQRDLRQVDISSGDITEGPVTIKSVAAVLTGVHIDPSFHGATVDRLTGSLVITFPEIASALAGVAGPLGSAVGGAGLTITPAGRNEVRATANLLASSFTATWRISRAGGNAIRARLVSSSGLTSGLLGSVSDITVPLPKLPLNVTIEKIEITPDGIVGRLAGHNLSFGS